MVDSESYARGVIERLRDAGAGYEIEERAGTPYVYKIHNSLFRRMLYVFTISQVDGKAQTPETFSAVVGQSYKLGADQLAKVFPGGIASMLLVSVLVSDTEFPKEISDRTRKHTNRTSHIHEFPTLVRVGDSRVSVQHRTAGQFWERFAYKKLCNIIDGVLEQ